MTDNPQAPPSAEGSELRDALMACKSSFFFAGFFSLFVNLLMLTPSLYMLAVYDRVLSSSSESTLLMLTLILVFVFAVMGGLEWIRSQILVTTSTRLDQMLSGRVFDSIFAAALATGGKTASAQPLSDLIQLRQFLTGSALFAFFDAPWMPIYVLLLFLFHYSFGVVGIFSMIVLILLAVWNEVATRSSLQQANKESIEASQMTQSHLRNAEAIEVMGMLPHMRRRWHAKQVNVLALQGQASSKAGLISAMVKTFRMAIQSLVLGLGAYLAIHKEISPGLVISGSILLGRALAPLDLMVSGWRGSQGARQAYARLSKLLEQMPARQPPMRLPAPKGEIRLENVFFTPAGSKHPILKEINLLIEPGAHVGVLGPSAAGKSTLVRALLGIYLPEKGSVRLDGSEIHHWDRAQLGTYVGYLPQDVELIDGTISENIARFGEIDAEKVVAAAQAAGIHEMIQHLPDGYDTRLAGGAHVLSAGQRQRVGIARAVYGDPRVVVLDEPNSNLDQIGDQALAATLASLKRKGCSVVVVTHRPNILVQVDRILLLVGGQVAFYGPRDQGLAMLTQGQQPPPQAAQAAKAQPPAN